MNQHHLFILLTLLTSVARAEPEPIAMGDGTIDGHLVRPYEGAWKQCQLQEGEWTDGGTVKEEAVVIGGVLRHQQTTRRPDGIVAVSTSYLDRASLAPLRLEQHVTGADGRLMGRSERAFNAQGFSGWVQRGAGDRQPVQGELNASAFNGAILGLPLSTLGPFQSAYTLDAFMLQFNAGYRVIVTPAGKETLETDQGALTTRLVDVEWHHENGDIYPPGPDASGGRFWILVEDHPQLPRVLRYKTDAYAVEVVKGFCP